MGEKTRTLENRKSAAPELVQHLVPQAGYASAVMEGAAPLTAFLFQGCGSWFLFHAKTDRRVHWPLIFSSRLLSLPNWGVALPAGFSGSRARCAPAATSGAGAGCASD
jgi:hypothetical protein